MGDIFGFVRERLEKHGPIFRTHLLFNPTVILAGPDACTLWLDDAKIQREGAFPDNLEALFGGNGILPLMDGDAHLERKKLILAGFDRAAIEAYVPIYERLFAARLADWAKQPSIAGIDELKRLAIEGIARTVLGLDESAADGEILNQLLADYQLVFKGMTALPINVPLTGYHGGLAAKDRILATLGKLAAARRDRPREDAISRVLAARTDAGKPIALDRLTLELHHAVLAGYIIFAELSCMLVELDKAPALRERLRKEIDESGAEQKTGAPFELKGLAAMPLLQSLVMETKRFCPNVPLSFGRARETFEFEGYTVEKGWFVFLAVTENNRFATSFDAPEKFDPDRFTAPRNEQDRHPHAYVPQGPGSLTQHKCAGADLSTWFMAAFIAHALRDYDWTIPAQDLSLEWGQVPPTPKDGLRLTLKARQR